jgi:hypothetical protein
MDRIAGKLPNTTSRLIAMAASMVGSVDGVMAVMKCTEAEFLEYLDGQKEPSWMELDRLVFLIITEQRKLMDKNRELLAAYRAKK